MKQSEKSRSLTIRKAEKEDVPLILGFIEKLAAYERVSRSFFITSLPFWASRESTWRICLYWRSTAARAMEKNCWPIWQFWTGTSLPLSYKSLGGTMMDEWTENRLTGENLVKLAAKF